MTKKHQNFILVNCQAEVSDHLLFTIALVQFCDDQFTIGMDIAANGHLQYSFCNQFLLFRLNIDLFNVYLVIF